MNILDLRANVLWDKYHPQVGTLNSASNLTSLFPVLISLGLLGLVIYVVRLVLRIKKTLNEPSVLLELTPPATTEKTAYTTQQFFSVIHTLGKQTFKDKLLGKKNAFSFEIVSTQNQGIRYLLRTSPKQVNTLKHHILSYLPQVNVKIVNEYLPENKNITNYQYKVIELKQTKHFAYPLEKQNTLEEHDPVAYITGMMTKLSPSELISFQMILSPTKLWETKRIKYMIFRGENVVGFLDKFNFPVYLQFIAFPIKVLVRVVVSIGHLVSYVLNDILDPKASQRARERKYMMNAMVVTNQRPARVLTQFEQQAVQSIEEKIDQKLFQAKMRLLMIVKEKDNLDEREKGFLSSLSVFSGENDQSLVRNFKPNIELINKYLFLNFRKRLLSFVFNSSSNILSISEVSDLYHFPFTRITQTENIVKVHSKELPAPVSLKNGSKLSVVLGKNNYGGEETLIGLTEEERKTHMYIIGRTGSGKTTLMFSMAKHDIEQGAGLAFIDPHGDVSEDLLASVPEKRKEDLVYINPFDLKHPVGINLLELTPGLDEDEAELEKEVVAEGVVSLFRKVFSKEENANAHRIEYILRNTIHTAFTTENPTIFTLYDLLNNPPFQKQVVAKLQDENLKNFWKFEFGRAGDFQVVKMVGGVTAKIGRFLFSPTAKRILEQRKSTINFNEILDGKILICNLSQGKLGEDTARLLGTTILTKLQQAALKRADIPQDKRKQFHLYVDEFQNFATLSFAKMLSEGRKYGLDVCIAEQSTSQQWDRSITNIIISNVTTVITFRTGNPIDEELLLGQLQPYVKQGEIQNLPRYRFYIKMSAIESEEPFSGQTIKVEVKRDLKKMERLLEVSRKNNTIVYKKPEITKTVNIPVNKLEEAIVREVVNAGGVPNMPEFQKV